MNFYCPSLSARQLGRLIPCIEPPYSSPPQPSGFTCIALPSVPFRPFTSSEMYVTYPPPFSSLPLWENDWSFDSVKSVDVRAIPKRTTQLPTHVLPAKGPRVPLCL